MKKSELISAIKTVLAENRKQKLDENKIRQIIREVLSEEVYDLVRDVKSALGPNPTKDQVEKYLGRPLDGDEMDAFGFPRMVGMKGGQPIYAGQKSSTDWRRQARGVRRRY